MASQNPNQRSKTPNPLARPRTNPLETKSRRLGEANKSGLSVHLGVHGRIISSTPNVAQTVTSSRERIRKSHSSKLLVFLCVLRPADWVREPPGIRGASCDVVEGGIVGSELNPHSRDQAGVMQ